MQMMLMIEPVVLPGRFCHCSFFNDKYIKNSELRNIYKSDKNGNLAFCLLKLSQRTGPELIPLPTIPYLR